MAVTSYGLNHPLAVKVWSRRLFEEVIKESYVGKFLGTSSNSLIQRQDDLTKGPGDRVRVGLRRLLTGRGVQGDATLEGNEEALVTFTQDVFIDQLRHAVRSGGKMSEQRIPFSVREEAMQGLKDWWTERLEIWCANHLTGNSLQTDTAYTGNNTVTAPDTNHWIIANQETAESSISTSTVHQFNIQLLDRAVQRAKTLSPKIRPVRINGSEYYVGFLHPNQVFQMRTNTNTGQWLDIQKSAFAAQEKPEANPIFSGALGIYNNVILHEWSYLPAFSTSGAGTNNVYRAVVAGAQALMLANGQDNGSARMTWREELFDYGNQLGVSAGMIGGVLKSTFNSADFATIAISTYSPTP